MAALPFKLPLRERRVDSPQRVGLSQLWATGGDRPGPAISCR